MTQREAARSIISLFMSPNGHPRRASEPVGPITNFGIYAFLGIFSIVFAVSTCHSLADVAGFIGRTALAVSCIYGIMFVFDENNGRQVTETFLISFSLMSLTYFVIKCPLEYFAGALILCAVVCTLFRFLE
jgi:hypothetical protein